MRILSAPPSCARPSSKWAARLVFYALIGLAIGIAIELLFSALNSTSYVPGLPSFLDQFSNQNLAVAVERLLYLLLGTVLGLASHIFDMERWSLVKATAAHYLVVVISVGTCGIVLHWFSVGTAALNFVLPVTVIYVFIWLTLWVTTWLKVRQARQALLPRG